MKMPQTISADVTLSLGKRRLFDFKLPLVRVHAAGSMTSPVVRLTLTDIPWTKWVIRAVALLARTRLVSVEVRG